MKTQLNEIQRMQRLAGIVNESQNNEELTNELFGLGGTTLKSGDRIFLKYDKPVQVNTSFTPSSTVELEVKYNREGNILKIDSSFNAFGRYKIGDVTNFKTFGGEPFSLKVGDKPQDFDGKVVEIKVVSKGESKTTKSVKVNLKDLQPK